MRLFTRCVTLSVVIGERCCCSDLNYKGARCVTLSADIQMILFHSMSGSHAEIRPITKILAQAYYNRAYIIWTIKKVLLS